MWNYIGIHRDRAHIERGCSLLNQLSIANTPHDLSSCSVEQMILYDAIQTALLIARAIRQQQGIQPHHSSRFSSFFNKVHHEPLLFDF